ncbi:hypothetical protein [Streptomyces sp. Z26]|uniref:hypothetical protein n=1 Tax=Streptomyces sp. Z26 TaxID=2500177 RepID=UPI000EF155F4|nr:hypothetical protein [Streptomyces sp. Z26]RLL67981.1 hypothetical protein D7M15_15300 [Streptomyces sp. Z26]
MTQREPPGHLAPHIPADAYRRAETTGQPLVIVHTTAPERPDTARFLVPLAVGTAATIGLLGTVAAILALFQFAAQTAAALAATTGPIGVGIGLKLARPKHR